MIILISKKRVRNIVCGALIFALAGLGVFNMVGKIESNILQASAEGNWGLSFQQ